MDISAAMSIEDEINELLSDVDEQDFENMDINPDAINKLLDDDNEIFDMSIGTTAVPSQPPLMSEQPAKKRVRFQQGEMISEPPLFEMTAKDCLRNVLFHVFFTEKLLNKRAQRGGGNDDLYDIYTDLEFDIQPYELDIQQKFEKKFTKLIAKYQPSKAPKNRKKTFQEKLARLKRMKPIFTNAQQISKYNQMRLNKLTTLYMADQNLDNVGNIIDQFLNEWADDIIRHVGNGNCTPKTQLAIALLAMHYNIFGTHFKDTKSLYGLLNQILPSRKSRAKSYKQILSLLEKQIGQLGKQSLNELRGLLQRKIYKKFTDSKQIVRYYSNYSST